MSLNWNALGEETVARIRGDVRDRLEAIGIYREDMPLLDYIFIMLANEKTKAAVKEDLQTFLADETDSFVDWLWKHIESVLEETGAPSSGSQLTSVATVPSTANRLRKASQSKRFFAKALKEATESTASTAPHANGGRVDAQTAAPAPLVGGVLPIPARPFPMPGFPLVPPVLNPLVLGAMADPARFAALSEDEKRAVQATYMTHMAAVQQMAALAPGFMPAPLGVAHLGAAQAAMVADGDRRGRKRRISERLGPAVDAQEGESKGGDREERMRDLSRRMGMSPSEAGLNGAGTDDDDASRTRRGGGKRRRTEQQVNLNVGSLDDVDVPRQAPKERCQYWPHCMNPACTFVHPSEPCSNFPNCTYGKKCLFVHPSVPCKYGPACANPQCNFTHKRPAPMVAPSSKICKHHPGCKKPRCPYNHPKQCHYGADCTRPGCTFFHPSAASQIVCKYLPNCTRAGCPYKHPSGGPMHVSQRRFAADTAVEATPANAEALAAEAAVAAASGSMEM